MSVTRAPALGTLALLISLLAACGGGGGGGSSADTSTSTAASSASGASAASAGTTPPSGTAATGTATSGTSTTSGPGTGTSQSPAATPTAGSSAAVLAQRALDRLNWWRTQAGLPVMAADSRIVAAGDRRANYLQTSGEGGHYETKTTNAWYDGYRVSDRLTANGYRPSYAAEVYTVLLGTDMEMLADKFITAVYHRFDVLATPLSDAGAGVAGLDAGTGFLVVKAGAPSTARGATGATGAAYVLPAPGQSEVPVDFFTDSEIPDPLPNQNRSGYAVTLSVPAERTLATTTFRLWTISNGNRGLQVPATVLTAATDGNMPSWGAALLPIAALSPLTTYEAEFVGTAGGQSLTRTWRFTTWGAPGLALSAPLRNGQTVTLKSVNLNPDEALQVCVESGGQYISTFAREDQLRVTVGANTQCRNAGGCAVTIHATPPAAACNAANARASTTFSILP